MLLKLAENEEVVDRSKEVAMRQNQSRLRVISKNEGAYNERLSIHFDLHISSLDLRGVDTAMG